MPIEFDAHKNDTNIRDRGLSFERAADFDFEAALYQQDTRRDYGEIRFRALGYLDGRLSFWGQSPNSPSLRLARRVRCLHRSEIGV